MIVDNIYDFGSWKCGKGKAFTHIPTNLLLLFEISSFKNHTEKAREQVFDSKKINIEGF